MTIPEDLDVEAWLDRFRSRLHKALPGIWAQPLADLPNECTVYACSDLHVDMPANREWLQALPVCTDPNSILIVAGDVQHDVDKLEIALITLAYKYARVFFVPGNHDLWAAGNSMDSATKFFALIDMLDRNGIGWLPTPITSSGLFVFPLFSWHSAALSTTPLSPSEYEVGFDMACKWPFCINRSTNSRKSSLSPSIPEFFRSLNDMTVDALSYCSNYSRLPKKRAITFSHFLPRLELYGGRFDLEKVMGDPLLDTQLRSCGSFLHVFGHSHRNVDREVDGVRYVQHALGNHRLPQLLWRPKVVLDGTAPPPSHSKGQATAKACAPLVLLSSSPPQLPRVLHFRF
eukprot:GGOE01004479.1.p1 GENE.GGOE01004479.1~~GGOE01004479.1.p1  ORF type:complete len:345 (+),score=98.67 GGOE01004479.1:51-1085(+)